jgi:RimJ/RimL family protein N-acetyltransferase
MVVKKDLPEEIVSERIVLRRHSEADASALFAMIDHDRNRLGQFLPSVDSTRMQWTEHVEFHYGVFRKSDQVMMGNCGVHTIYWERAQCELGYWIGKDFAGQGFVSEAVGMIEKELFALRFERLEIRCSSINEGSIRVAEKNGFTLIETLKKDMIENDRYRDTLVFAKMRT